MGRVVDRILHVHALSTEHRRADRDSFRDLIEIRNHEGSLRGSNPSGFVVAREELDGVSAGKERTPGVVFNGAMRQLRRTGIAQLDIDEVSKIRRSDAGGFILNFG